MVLDPTALRCLSDPLGAQRNGILGFVKEATACCFEVDIMVSWKHKMDAFYSGDGGLFPGLDSASIFDSAAGGQMPSLTAVPFKQGPVNSGSWFSK